MAQKVYQYGPVCELMREIEWIGSIEFAFSQRWYRFINGSGGIIHTLD